MVLGLFLAGATTGRSGDDATNRPAQWGQPIALAGVPNFHKVTDTLYRSAQPTAEGMKNLHAMGIRTVINLRSFNTDRDEIGELPLQSEHIYMKAWHPEEKEAVWFLRIACDTNRAPVLVHCQHGADRTGTMCALYRVAVQNWNKSDATREMTEGGYGFHSVWGNLPKWLDRLDVETVKKKAGLAGN
jgi:protein tyrosine/serine phosphatase